MEVPAPDELDLGMTVRGFNAGQKVFQRYSLVRILGRGGMGVVWLARDGELDRNVALKFLPEMLLHERALLEGLKTETRRSLELTHRHIVRIYDFIQDAQSSCISMEYVDGETLSYLRARKESQVFEPAEIEAYIRDICEALEYAHEKARIVHRDLKPSNLMVNSRDEVKIADFGIARSLSDSVSMMTMSQHTSGTLVYMSPQQLEGERTSPLDDVYSLGAVLYELLTSKPPFFRGQVDHQIRTREPASIAERRAEFGITAGPVPMAWQKTIAACLSKNPAERPQSARQVAEQLSSAAAPPVLPPTLVAHPVNRERASDANPVPPGGVLGQLPVAGATARAPVAKSWIFVAIAAVILLLGIILVYALLSNRKSEPATAEAETSAVSPAPQSETAPGKIIVNTIPADAVVYLDGNNRGRSPVIIEDVPPGTHHLAIEATGFEPTTLIADVKAGGTVDFGTMHLRAKPASSPSGAASVANAPVAATPSPTLAPAPTASRDLAGEVRQFVLSHLRKWVNGDISGQLADYAERVDYYENGMVDRSFIARDRQTYASAWPNLNLVPHGDIRLRETGSTGQVVVYFDYRFEARNSKGIKSTGNTSNVWTLDTSSSDFKIVSEKQTVTNRKRSR